MSIIDFDFCRCFSAMGKILIISLMAKMSVHNLFMVLGFILILRLIASVADWLFLPL